MPIDLRRLADAAQQDGWAGDRGIDVESLRHMADSRNVLDGSGVRFGGILRRRRRGQGGPVKVAFVPKPMDRCLLEFMGQAETLPDQRLGAVRREQPVIVLRGGAAGHRQVNDGAHEGARPVGRWSESVLAQPDLSARTNESVSQFDGTAML